jgi:hypothetical protein
MRFLFVISFLLLASMPAFGGVEEYKFFREPIAVLWTYQGEGSESWVVEARYSIAAENVLPNIFGDLGFAPTEIVGGAIYESNPAGEGTDAIWTNVTCHYDDLLGVEWLEGRAIYQDTLLDSFLGAGLGLSPIDDSWVGCYFLGCEGYKVYAECAYPFSDTEDGLWCYGVYEY